jgi:hypothetical protein
LTYLKEYAKNNIHSLRILVMALEEQITNDTIRIPDDCDVRIQDEIIRALVPRSVLENIRPRLEGVLFSFRNLEVSDTAKGSGRSIIRAGIEIAGLDPTGPLDLEKANEVMTRFNKSEISGHRADWTFAITYESLTSGAITVPHRLVYQPTTSVYQSVINIPKLEGALPTILKGQKGGGLNAKLHSFNIEQKRVDQSKK